MPLEVPPTGQSAREGDRRGITDDAAPVDVGTARVGQTKNRATLS